MTATLARPLFHASPRADCPALLALLIAQLSVLFCFLTAIPLIFSDTYSFTPGESGLVLIGIAVGCMLGGIALALLDSYTTKRHRATSKDELPPPERMLWGAMLGGPLMPGALFWFAWTAQPGVHSMSSILATGLSGCSNILIFVHTLPTFRTLKTNHYQYYKVSTILYLANVYGAQYGASALAANGLLRCLVGGSFPLFTTPSEFSTSLPIKPSIDPKKMVYQNLGYPWASSVLAFVAVGFAFLPWIFFKSGSKIRHNSAFTLLTS